MAKVSKTGYKKNSKDKNEPALVIPSNKITMKDVDFPVFGIDDMGYSQMMYPGMDYNFPGDFVYEIPMARYGGDPSIPDLSEGWLSKYQTAGQVEDPKIIKSGNGFEYGYVGDNVVMRPIGKDNWITIPAEKARNIKSLLPGLDFDVNKLTPDFQSFEKQAYAELEKKNQEEIKETIRRTKFKLNPGSEKALPPPVPITNRYPGMESYKETLPPPVPITNMYPGMEIPQQLLDSPVSITNRYPGMRSANISPLQEKGKWQGPIPRVIEDPADKQNAPKNKTSKVVYYNRPNQEEEEPGFFSTMRSYGQYWYEKNFGVDEAAESELINVEEEPQPAVNNKSEIKSTKENDLAFKYNWTPGKAYFLSQDSDIDYGKPNVKFWGFRRTAPNVEGLTYVPTPRKENFQGKGISNVAGMAHFLIKSDLTDGFKDPETIFSIEKNIKENKYIPIYKKEKNGQVRLKYVKGSEPLEQGWDYAAALRQEPLANIDWDKSARPYLTSGHAAADKNKRSGKGMFGKGISNILTKDGRDTWMVYKENNGKGGKLGRFNGNSVVFIIEKNGERIIRDFTGTVQAIEDESKELLKEFNVDPKDVTLAFYDQGSYSAKPKANKKGFIPYSTYSDFNPEKVSAAGLAVPLEYLNPNSNFRYGGWLKEYQKGGSRRLQNIIEPIYVDSKNDPRYKAYADSLLAYNLAPIYNRSILNNLEKANTVVEAVIANLQTNDDFYKKGMNFSLGFNRREFPRNEVSDGFAGAIKYDFKKPVQPVEVRKEPQPIQKRDGRLTYDEPTLNTTPRPLSNEINQEFGATQGYSAGDDLISKFIGNFNLETGEWSFKEKKPVKRELTLQQPFKEGGWIEKYQTAGEVKPTSNFTLPSLDPQAQQSADYAKGWEEYNKGVEQWTGLLAEKEEKKGRSLTTEEKQRWLQKAVRKTDGRKTEVDPNDPKWNFLFKDSYQTYDPEFGPMTVMTKPIEYQYDLTDLDKKKQKIAAKTRESEMTPFAKSLGMNPLDPRVQKRASQNANDQVALEILGNKPQGDRTRVEWLNSLTPEERSTIERSQYAGKLDPDFTSQFSQGLEKNLRNAANIAAVGPIDWYQGNNLINQPLWTNSDYTQEEAANASAMGIMAPLSYPTNLVTGAITGDFGSALQGQRSMPLFTDYRQPEFASTMSGLYEAGYDPLNAVGIGIMEKVPVGKMTSELAAKQARNFNQFLTGREGRFYKPKFGTLDVNTSPEELRRLAEIDEASSINAYSYRPNDSSLTFDQVQAAAEHRKNEAAKTFLEKAKYLTDDEVRQIFGKSRDEILQYKPDITEAAKKASGSIDLTRPSNTIMDQIARSGDPQLERAAHDILTSFNSSQAEEAINGISSPMWRDRLREYARTYYPEMAQVDQSAQAANQLPPPPETLYLDLDGSNITSGYQSGSYAAQRAAEDLPPPPPELNNIIDTGRSRQNIIDRFSTPPQNNLSINWQNTPSSWADFYNQQQPLSLTDELRNIPRNVRGMFNLAEKQPDRLATPSLYAQSYSTPREMLMDVTEKLNDAILNANAGDIITGSTNTSHNSFLVQMDYIAKNAGKEDLSEPIFLGYGIMNDSGFLSLANIPKTDIINYINSNLNKIQKKRGVNFNFGNKPTYIDEYDQIRIPQYGVKKITPKGEFSGIKKKYGGWLSKYQKGGEMPFGLPLKSANPGSPWAYESPEANGYLLPDVNRPQLLNTGATEYKMGIDDNVVIPTVVNGQYMSPDDAYVRYILTGEQFKPMADPHSYSAFYDTVGPLGLMKYPDGGGTFNKSVNKKGNLKTSAEGYYAYINGVNLSNGGSPKTGWLNKYNKK